MKSAVFNGLLMAVAVGAAYWLMYQLPDRRELPAVSRRLHYRAVPLPPSAGPLGLSGAWVLEADDPRFHGLSALTMDGERFLAVSDLGAVARFDPPFQRDPHMEVLDLRMGPGPFGKKWSRDAESIVRDPAGRGWWVGYEQRHSLWLYDNGFNRALDAISLDVPDWRDNRGAEGLLAESHFLLVTAENGRDAIEVAPLFSARTDLNAGMDVADAARAPDGSDWLLLRSKGLDGISQMIAPMLKDGSGYRAGPAWLVPKGPLDNFEGMAIAPLPNGAWRFWLATDDGHRVMARTLLVALDYMPPGDNKNPATRAGLSKKTAVKKP